MEWPVLEGLDALARTSLLRRSVRRTFDRHEVVFHENDPGDTFHLIEQGLVEVQITTPLGDVATLPSWAGETSSGSWPCSCQEAGALPLFVRWSRSRRGWSAGKPSRSCA